MKKIYQHPEIKVVNVKTTAHLLSESLPTGEDYDGESVILSRGNGGSFWDDDEDNTEY